MSIATYAARLARNYIAAWNETDAGRRAALMDAQWTPDARYVDPMGATAGRAAISAMIGAVHERFPGFRFALDGEPDGYGAPECFRLRFSWTLGPEAAPDVIQGSDVAEAVDGWFSAVTGFLDKVPG